MEFLQESSTMYTSFFSLALFLILFESRYSRKKTVILTLCLMVPLMLVNCALLLWVGPATMSTLLLLTCSLPSMVFFWILAKYRDGRFFFTFCLADTLVLEILYGTMILDYFLGNSHIFLFCSRMVLCPLMAWVIFRWLRRDYLELQDKVAKGWWTCTLIALIFYVVLSMAVSIPTLITQRKEQIPAFILLLVLLPVVYLHIFSTIQHQLKVHEMLQKENILQLQVANMRAHMKELDAADARFREERHDFRHKLLTIAGLAESEKYDQLQTLIREYTESVPSVGIKSYCDYSAIDAVLALYLRRAEEKGITIHTKIHFPEELPASESELALVFANALENAIHASEKLPPADRYLEVQVLTVPCFMLQIRNRYDGIVAFDKDGIPMSHHKDHGFGTRSIVTFCEKNHAFCEFKADETYFYLRIIFE